MPSILTRSSRTVQHRQPLFSIMICSALGSRDSSTAGGGSGGRRKGEERGGGWRRLSWMGLHRAQVQGRFQEKVLACLFVLTVHVSRKDLAMQTGS